MAVLYIRDENGNFVPIPAIKGASAYDQAKLGGYRGTEAEFIALLNGLTNSEDATHYTDFNNPHNVSKEQVGLGNVDNTSDMDKPVSYAQQALINAMAEGFEGMFNNLSENHMFHQTNVYNPHAVTAEQVGAIPTEYYASEDLNTELRQGGNKMTVCNYHSGTLNSPYKAGLTVFAHGMVITNANSAQYATQLCIPSGSPEMFVRSLSGEGVTQWVKAVDTEWRNNMHHEVYNNIKPELQSCMRIETGTYKGTNTYGTKNPCILTFDFVPQLVIVSKQDESNVSNGSTFIWINPATTLNFNNNGSTCWCYPSLEGTTFSWYNTESAAYQLNSSNYEYSYLSWGVAL